MSTGLVGMLQLDWRKIKQDLQSELTEASVTGTIFSVAAAFFMMFLVVSHVSDYRAVKYENNVELDHFDQVVPSGMDNAEDMLMINFAFRFPRLVCDYASIDAENFLGTHVAGISQTVKKFHLDKNGQPMGEHKERDQPLSHHADAHPVKEGAQDYYSVKLADETFEMATNSHELLVVYFFAPWCHWCTKFTPVYEEIAKEMIEKYPDGSVTMARVDCTAPSSLKVCKDKRIDAFPTIKAFRSLKSGEHSEERFLGSRLKEPFTAWIEHLREQLFSKRPETKFVDVDQDGHHDSHHGVGCLFSGHMYVQKSPGKIAITANTGAHNFDWTTMDMSHYVDRLSFGPGLGKDDWKLMPLPMKQSVYAMNAKNFSSQANVPTTHEHYVKVIKGRVEVPKSYSKKPVIAYGYTSNSNFVQRFAEVPSVRIMYDILPVVVTYRAYYNSFYDFVTKMCGVVGGVFTVAGMLSAGVDNTVTKILKKESLGKLG